MKRSIVHFSTALTLIVGSAGCSDALDPLPDDTSGNQASPLLYNGQYAIHYDLGGNPTQCVYEGVSIHCCPSNQAMFAARVDQNTFACLHLAVNGGRRFLDKGTQRMGMHACPLNAVMVGYHEGLNWLVCQETGKNVREDVDFGSQTRVPTPYDFDGTVGGSVSAHACKLPGMEGGLMSGIHNARNQFLCAADATMPPPPPPAGGGGGSTSTGTTSTVTATITVDQGSAPPTNGCGSTSFVLDGAPMTFQGAQLVLDSIYRCRYTAAKAGVSLGSHTVTVNDFSACRSFSASSASTPVTLTPFQCF